VNDEAPERQKLVWEQAEARARQGDMAYVRELGSRLSKELNAAVEQVRELDHGLTRAVRMLALTPGRDSLVQLIRLMDEDGPFRRSGTEPRVIASLLAETQQPADLSELLYDRTGRDELDELRSCLFHELLLRGVATEDFRPLRSWPVVRPGWHTLSWLPTELRPFETASRSLGRSAHGGVGGPVTGLTDEDRLDPPTPRTTERSPLRDVATAEVHEAVVAAPNAGDFGDFGAWAFAFDAPVDPILVPALVPTLPMACVDGLGPSARFEIARRPLTDIWQMLFSTASMGGVYGPGAHGAFGRRATWWSLAGLGGAPVGASWEEVERCAVESTWFHFECDSDWFHNEIYDYGIAALSPDRRRITVLAATDTD
jgi:hypothetical protein